jgi:TrmH family RNA methyltransferase
MLVKDGLQPGPHRVRVIESEANAIFKDLKNLLGGRGVKKQGRTLVCGPRLVAEVMERYPKRCLAWISSGERHRPPSDAPDHLQWVQLAPELFQILDTFGTKHPHPSLRCSPAGHLAAGRPSKPGCSLLVPFQDPENVGAVDSLCRAFDVDRIILLAESANPFHPKAIRASAGTVFSARLFAGPSLSALPQIAGRSPWPHRANRWPKLPVSRNPSAC